MDINVGWPGKVHDARVFAKSSFFHCVNSGVYLPNWTRENKEVEVQLYILGDPAYPLLPWLMKPYAESVALTNIQRVFNYRQSRARMVAENAFGRLKGRWRCLSKRMDYYNVDHAINVSASCITLHNICEAYRDTCDSICFMQSQFLAVRHHHSQIAPVHSQQV